MTKKQELDEKIQTGGGATGVAHTADPVGGRATLPASNLNNGESMNKIASVTPGQGEEDTDTANNVKAVGNAAASNKASVSMKASSASSMKEDVEAMFNGEELSEEFKEKATVIFEAAVTARAQEIGADLEEQYNTALAEEVARVEQEIEAKVGQYMDYVAEQWMEENQLAIESAVRTEITESFMDGLKKLFEEHYITLPEEKVDVVEALQQEVTEMQERLDSAMQESMGLKKQLESSALQNIFADVAEGLTATQAEKFASLAEGVEFDTTENYRKKLEIVKENYFPTEKSSTAQNLLEEVDESAQQQSAPVNSAIAQYASAISRTIKK